MPDDPSLPPATASYRLQLRNGVGFAEAEAILPYLAGLGIDRLFLSPIQTAREGSTHGYDIADPTRIDPVLGGREGFSRLAATAKARGIGLILDIVPNHMAFDLNTPWLADVLRHGQDSRYARHFDIDWSDALRLPILAAPHDEVLGSTEAEVVDGPGGPVLRLEGLELPLAPGSEEGFRADREGALQALVEAQPWALRHWKTERRRLSHRRFFNVTDLIGVRVEEPQVFEDTHALIFDLVAAGEVAGLRVDHIDGLADPAAYLRALRARVGDLPVWVEKILTGDEALRDWPVQGTTGYEAARALARLLTDAGGLARIDAAWRRATGYEDGFAATLAKAKQVMLDGDLAAEVAALTGMAATATGLPAEQVKAAVRALLIAFPRYRTYFDGGAPHPEDRVLMIESEARATGHADPGVLAAVACLVSGPQDDPVFRTRFQQVTGALTAKAHEDTAEFRFNRCLAHNEVGADPDEPVLTPAGFEHWFRDRIAHAPDAMVLTSSHDTKRAEDARMRLVAMTHDPVAFAELWQAAQDLPGAAEVPANMRWYAVQSWLAIWEPHRDDLADRLAAHLQKALREAKEITTHAEPDEAAEAPVLAFGRVMALHWTTPPAPAERLIAVGAHLSMAHLALRLMLPGLPDIYQGSEDAAFHLTDPDNRLPVDFARLAQEGPASDLGREKIALIRRMLSLRAAEPRLFRSGEAAMGGSLAEGLWLERSLGGRRLRLQIAPPARTGDRPGAGLEIAATGMVEPPLRPATSAT